MQLSSRDRIDFRYRGRIHHNLRDVSISSYRLWWVLTSTLVLGPILGSLAFVGAVTDFVAIVAFPDLLIGTICDMVSF